MIVAETRTAAGVAAAAGAAAAAAAAAAASTEVAVPSPDETAVSAQNPSRWALVEPWSSLLLAEHGQGGKDRDDAQDRKLAEVQLGDGEQDRAILQDAARTRSDTPAFRDPNARQWLERSVSLFCRERGLHYTQGLTELAAPWALITEPPCLSGLSYRCFCSFVDRFARNIFATAPDVGAAGVAKGQGREGGAFVVLEAHLVLLEQLLRFHDPTLAVHLDKCCDGPAAYATPWFVTLFARQMPIPALLHLWQRLAEHGQPVLLQFLALAWLVRNRRVLLDTPREDVLETVTRLRLASAEVVDCVLRDALALRESTPRLFCDLLTRACYSNGRVNAEGASKATAADSAADSPEKRMTERNKSGATNAATMRTTQFRIGLLVFLRATGVLTVDANQVAEILLAQPSAPVAAYPTDEEDRRQPDAATRFRRRFVLVDCRPPQDDERDGSSPGAPSSRGATRVGEEVGAGGRHVMWRRINPTESFARQVGVVSEILRESCGGGGGGEAEQAVRPLESVGRDTGGSPRTKGVVEEFSVQDGGGTVYGSNGVAAHQGEDGVNGFAANGVTLHRGSGDHVGSSTSSSAAIQADGASNPSIESATHVCFIGMGGGLSNSSDGSDSKFSSPTEAQARAAAPEFRLALVASLTCLTPHVCVLEGGFPALDQALRRSRFEDIQLDVSDAGIDDGEEPVDDAGDPHLDVGQGSTDPANGEVAASATGIGGADKARDESPRSAAASAEGGLAADAGKTTPTGGSSLNPASPAGGGGGGEPAPLSAISRGLERKASRLAENRRISEPFRMYAAKSADDLALGLRSLPLVVSKPLEDAARVCNSLAKTNVRALGDSRLSLSRSVTRLEQLNARMDGTARGFARHFGAGWHRQEVSSNQLEQR